MVISQFCCNWHVSFGWGSTDKERTNEDNRNGVGAAAVSQLLFFSNVRVRDNCTKDDLGPARGAVIAAILGLACWTTFFIIGQWIFG
jgi:hypothetical protein